jgi:uncharacterized protein YdaU (DUF1376 family)
VQTDQPLDKLVREFRDSLPKIAARTASRWAITAPALATFFSNLRDTSLTHQSRFRIMEDLREVAKQLPDVQEGW